MGALSDAIQDDGRRRQIVDDAVRVVDAEVGDKRGMSGLAVKAGFKVVKGFKPGIIPQAVNSLLDDFAACVDPFHERCGDGDLRAYFVAHAAEIADTLLGITDQRAARSRHRTLKKAYSKLRPQGKKHTIAAMPRVADLVKRHVR